MGNLVKMMTEKQIQQQYDQYYQQSISPHLLSIQSIGTMDHKSPHSISPHISSYNISNVPPPPPPEMPIPPITASPTHSKVYREHILNNSNSSSDIQDVGNDENDKNQ